MKTNDIKKGMKIKSVQLGVPVTGVMMDNMKGKFVQPDKEWIDKLSDFCDKNNIVRDGWAIESDCFPKNCIEVNGKPYLVDIDYKWRIDKNA